MPFQLPFLFAAGFFGAVLNAIAGGGTFITFPALLLVGVPPISANATNTFASCSGYISGAYGFRRELRAHRKELPRFVLIGLLGGIAGAWLLLQTPELLFREAIPWLLLFATCLFVFARVIAWPEGITMIAGAITGGYLAAHISRRTPQAYLNGFVVFASTAITVYFFYDTYVV